MKPISYTLNIRGKLIDLATPKVMGILNCTPDSFYVGSRKQTEHDIAERANQIIQEGGTMIDVGAFSTRPGAKEVSEEEEMARLKAALQVVRREQPDAVVSVDTYRPNVARHCIEDWGADIINDVSEGGVTGIVNTPILDPGFGFGKTLQQNYEIYNDMERLGTLQLPLLVGISRKTMIYKLIGGDPTTALNGTTVLNTAALLKGAGILRVHDVQEAVESVKIVSAIQSPSEIQLP